MIVVGVNHRTAPIAVREGLAFRKEALGDALLRMRAETGASECLILSTCNRVEIYAEVDDPDCEQVVAFLAAYHGRSAAEVAPHLYRLSGDQATRHAFRVAASLDSMVVGEAQILGQVKDAYQAAEEAGTLGPVLGALRNRSLAAAKRVRTETEIGQNAVSVSHVAVELAKKIFGDLAGRNVLLVGAGKMSELAARQLVKGGAAVTVLGGRTFERAATLAAALGGSAKPFEALRDELAGADIVISSTGAPHLVILREDVERARKGRGGRPLFLVDIAAPRDVDPAVRELDATYLYDLDDLKAVSEANLRARSRSADAGAAIVEREVEEFLAWQRSLAVAPLLKELRRRGEAVAQAEVERLCKSGGLSAQQASAVAGLASSIVNKLLHAPTVQLKEAAQGGQAEQLRLLCCLLELPQPTFSPAAGAARREVPPAMRLGAVES